MEVIFLNIKGTFTLGGQRFNSGYTPSHKFMCWEGIIYFWADFINLKIPPCGVIRKRWLYFELSEMDNDQIPEPQQ